MAATKVFILLLSASVLLISQQKRVTLDAPSVVWAAEIALKPGTVFRDRLKRATEGPEMVVIPAGKFRMGDIHGRNRPSFSGRALGFRLVREVE